MKEKQPFGGDRARVTGSLLEAKDSVDLCRFNGKESIAVKNRLSTLCCCVCETQGDLLCCDDDTATM